MVYPIFSEGSLYVFRKKVYKKLSLFILGAGPWSELALTGLSAGLFQQDKVSGFSLQIRNTHLPVLQWSDSSVRQEVPLSPVVPHLDYCATCLLFTPTLHTADSQG